MANRAAHLFASAARHPGKPAIIHAGGAISFAQLAARVRAAAAALSAQGIRQGSHAALMMPTQPDFIIVQQALFALGAVVSPLNTQYRAGEVAHALASCDIAHLILPPALADRVPPGFAGAILRDPAATDPPVSESGFALAEVAAGDTVMLLHTSATTGKSKGVMLSAANLAANYDRTPGWLGVGVDDVICCTLPLYNTFGLNQCINAAMLTGATLVLLERFEAGDCIAAIRKHRCTFLPAVPTMLQKLVDHPLMAEGGVPSLARIMTGGAPVPAPLLVRVLAAARADCTVLTGYGLTEASALVTLTRVELDSDGEVVRGRSIGRTVHGVELAVRGEDGADLPAGETGEFVVRGPNVMTGYYNAPAANAEVFDRDWLRTGDLGYLDADGYAFIVDRKKDVIIRGGQNIYPADIEEALYGFPGVAEVAVIGKADDVLGEVPLAFVALNTGAQVSVEVLLGHCGEQLARFKLPAEIRFLPELPKGPTGKILRRALRDSAQGERAP